MMAEKQHERNEGPLDVEQKDVVRSNQTEADLKQVSQQKNTGGEIEGDDVPRMAALREAAREHTDAFLVKTDLEDADQREASPGTREQD